MPARKDRGAGAGKQRFMPTITFYSKPNCPLCDQARYALRQLLATAPDPAAWAVDEVNILDDAALFAAYRDLIPVVVVAGGRPVPAPESLDPARLRVALQTPGPLAGPPAPPIPAAPPATDPPGGAPGAYRYPYGTRPAPGGILGALDHFGNSLGTHWLTLANTLLGTFSTLPWLAPIFAALGWWFLADPIYTVYMLFCHQLPERAGNLFGYQVAYCYRNTAIYSTIFVLGLLFAAARRGRFGGRLAWMLRPLRWQVFLLLLVPIGLDGMTHLLGLREDNAWFDLLTGGRFGDFSVGDTLGTLNWWLRIITGSLFGFAIVRLIYPWIQIAFDESRHLAGAPPLRPPALEVRSSS